jgi:anti-sigma factor RsiW
MNKPKVTEADLHSYLDGELPAPERARVEALLADDADAEQRLGEYRHVVDLLRERYDGVLDEPVPQRLIAVTSTARRRTFRILLRCAAVFAWLALGGLAGWHLHGVQAREDRAAAPVWAHRAAVAHIVYSPEVRHPVEVGADQEAHLVAWLSKRLGTQLRIPQLGAVGYSLVGGRLLPGERGPAAQFMYQDAQGQRLTLYVRTNREQNKETAFRFAQDGNVRIFYWVDRSQGLALSGEIDKEQLLRVATAVYQQLNP